MPSTSKLPSDIAAETSSQAELSAQEKARLWREWAESHRSDTVLLSDEEISRESIYRERG